MHLGTAEGLLSFFPQVRARARNPAWMGGPDPSGLGLGFFRAGLRIGSGLVSGGGWVRLGFAEVDVWWFPGLRFRVGFGSA